MNPKNFKEEFNYLITGLRVEVFSRLSGFRYKNILYGHGYPIFFLQYILKYLHLKKFPFCRRKKLKKVLIKWIKNYKKTYRSRRY